MRHSHFLLPLVLLQVVLKRILSIGLVFSLLGVFDIALASSTQFTFGSTTIFDTGSANDSAIANLDTTHVIAVTKNGAAVGTVSGNAIAFGSISVFDAQAVYTSVTAIDSTHAVISYIDQSVNHKAVVATVSGTSVSYGSAVTISSIAEPNIKQVAVTTLDATHVAIAYDEENNDARSNPGSVVIGTISGTSITLGSPAVYSPDDDDYPSIATLDSTHFILSYRDSGAQKIIAGSVSGTSITLGSGVSPGFGCTDSSVTAVDSSHAIMVYCDANASNHPKVVLATITGTSVSLGTPLLFLGSVAQDFSFIKIDATDVAIGYRDVSGAGHAIVSLVTINGSTLTVETGIEAIAGNVAFVSMALTGTNTIVVVSPNASDSNKGYAVVGTIELTTSSSSSASGGDGGPSPALVKLRAQNGLDRWGYPLSPAPQSSSASSGSSDVGSSSSSSASTSSSEAHSSTEVHPAASSSASSVASASSSSFSSRSSVSSPAQSNLQIRTCNRVMKWFGADGSVIERLNVRLMKWFGFTCAG